MEKNHVKIWNNCLDIIRDNINRQSYKTWFEPIVPLKIENDVLTIQVPSQFFYEWIEEHFIDLLRKTIRKELGQHGKLEYSIIVDNTTDEDTKPLIINLPTSDKRATRNPSVSMPIDMNELHIKEIPNPFIIPGLKKLKIPSQLNDNNSFENFVEGDCNRLARSAGLAVAANPGKTAFNPLLIFSNTGLGKTHLVQAIGLQVKNNFPDKTVLYVSAPLFFQQFVDALKTKNTNDFIHFYQMIDVLIIDDIQFLAKKDVAQDHFFQIFNHLHQNNKQIIITSDKPPVEMQGIEPRMLSRFKWGLSADLQVPNLETRIAILEKKLYNDGITFPKDVIEYIAYSITTNVRELEGAIISIIAQSSFNKKTITLDLAKQMIDKFVKTNSKEISIDYIEKVICDYFNISLDQLNSKTRKREIVQARQLAMYFAKKLTKASLANIGMHCGNKDHATVLHACRTVNNLIDTDKHFRIYVEELDKKIKL